MLHKFLMLRGLLGGTGSADPETIILVDEAGTEVTAVLTDEELVFDATANDIRLGKTAATDSGVTVGTKDIPAYYTTEGVKIVTAGSKFSVVLATEDRYQYTKLQVIICGFNSSLSDSVAAEKVSINDGVYDVSSAEILASVTMDAENKAIDLGITNDGDTPCVMRYFTYKEEL